MQCLSDYTPTSPFIYDNLQPPSDAGLFDLSQLLFLSLTASCVDSSWEMWQVTGLVAYALLLIKLHRKSSQGETSGERIAHSRGPLRWLGKNPSLTWQCREELHLVEKDISKVTPRLQFWHFQVIFLQCWLSYRMHCGNKMCNQLGLGESCMFENSDGYDFQQIRQ